MTTKKATNKSTKKAAARKKAPAGKQRAVKATAPPIVEPVPQVEAQDAENVNLRHELFVEGRRRGLTGAAAARLAGYAESSAKGQAARLMQREDIRRRVQERVRDAQVETAEIIGTLVSHMRADIADIAPDDVVLQDAKARGVSHLIKEFTITEGRDGERDYKFKLHDSFAAASKLCSVYGLEKLPAPNPETARRFDEAVERFIERAAERGLAVTPEVAREKLKPYFEAQGVH